uniref:Uncharacterized protein n=1 Tax=Arundo donax TaxID=35708 RepID=A0A0A9EU61_ARUDO
MCQVEMCSTLPGHVPFVCALLRFSKIHRRS